MQMAHRLSPFYQKILLPLGAGTLFNQAQMANKHICQWKSHKLTPSHQNIYNKQHNSWPTRSSRLCHVSENGGTARFCSAARCRSHERGYQAAGAPGRWPGLHRSSRRGGSRSATLMSCSAVARRFTSPRAQRRWDLHLSGRADITASICRAGNVWTVRWRERKATGQRGFVQTGRQADSKDRYVQEEQRSEVLTHWFSLGK